MYSFKEKQKFKPTTQPYSRLNSRLPEKFSQKPRAIDSDYTSPVGYRSTGLKQETTTSQYEVVHYTPKSMTKTPSRNDYCVNNSLPNTNGSYEIAYGVSYEDTGSEMHSRSHFVRPRQPLVREVKPGKNFDQSSSTTDLDWNSWNISEQEISVKAKFSEFPSTSKSYPVTQEIMQGGFQIKNRENLFRVLTGTVENILQWSKLKNTLHILFEMIATLDDIQPGRWKSEKVLSVSDFRNGPSMQVVFYEIDRPLPKLQINSTVVCVGRLLTRTKLQAFKVEEALPEQKSDFKRLAFICNRVVEEISGAKKQ